MVLSDKEGRGFRFSFAGNGVSVLPETDGPVPLPIYRLTASPFSSTPTSEASNEGVSGVEFKLAIGSV